MPYIVQEKRNKLDPAISELVTRVTVHGELNYVLTSIAIGWLQKVTGGAARYSDRQNLYGTLCAVAAEFYRRALATYENGAIDKNGDLHAYEDLDK